MLTVLGTMYFTTRSVHHEWKFDLLTASHKATDMFKRDSGAANLHTTFNCQDPRQYFESWYMAFWTWCHRFAATVYPKKYAHGFCFAVLCCGYTLTDFPISIRLTSLALWQSNDCPSVSKATLINMDKYFMWIHYERLHDHNKAQHKKTVCIFLGIYCTCARGSYLGYRECLYTYIHGYTDRLSSQ